MRQEKQDIDQQLRAIQGSGMGSMQNFPMSRRSDRAYSNDYDSRSNRGSSRGGRGSSRGNRNSMSSGPSNPRYSNRRGQDRGGEDTEEEFHRGSSYSNSNKFQGGRGSSRGNYSQGLNKNKNDYRRPGGKDDHPHREHASSIDRGMLASNLLVAMIADHSSIVDSQSSNENSNRRRRRNRNQRE